MSEIFNKLLIPSDFTSNRPTFTSQGVPGVKYANFILPVNLTGDTRYGYVKVKFLGETEFVEQMSTCFLAASGNQVGVGTDLNYIMTPNPINGNLVETKIISNGTDYPREYYVIVNGYGPTTQLNIMVAVGFVTPPPSVIISIEVTCVTELYSYTTGLHVYSPYDSISNNAIYKTKIYSRVPYTSWVRDTAVFMDPLFENPALPYYYGINDKVIKIGSDFDRAFGTKERYRVVKKRWKKPRTYHDILGPQWWLEDPNNNPYSYSCVKPQFSRVGLVEWVANSNIFDRPQQYRYYMGFSESSTEAASSGTFTYWDWGTRQAYPLIGSTHALMMMNSQFAGGYSYHGNNLLGLFPAGFNTDDLNQGLGWAALAAGAILTGLIIYDLILVTAAFYGTGLVSGTIFVTGGILCSTTSLGAALGASIASAGIALVVIAVILLLIGLFSLLQHWTHTYDQDCGYYEHCFTTTPYIRNFISQLPNFPQIYRNVQRTNVRPGYHTEGIYGFRQTTYVDRYEVARVNSVSQQQPISLSYQTAWQPDLQNIITGWANLVILIYVSGKPIPYCGGRTIYYNGGITVTLEKELLRYCDLEVQEQVTVTVPPQIFHSCVSQSQADQMEQSMLENLITQAIAERTQVAYPDEFYGWFDDAQFTHELKIESNPTNVSLMYEASKGLQVGTPLYYDYFGCNKVLDGYYSTTGTSVYRRFYKTTNGVISAILDMATPTSTTTTTGQPIVTTYLDYTSNWYLFDTDLNRLEDEKTEILRILNFNPNTLYPGLTINSSIYPSTSYQLNLRKGFTKTPGDVTDFKVFENFVSPNIRNADYGFYQPLIDWIDESIISYGRYPNLEIVPEENCSTTAYNNPVFKVKFYKISFGNYVSFACPQNLTLSLDIYGSRSNIMGRIITVNAGQSEVTVNLAGSNIGHIVRVNVVIQTTASSLLTTYNINPFVSCYGVSMCNGVKLWTGKNLDVTTYRNGETIPLVTNVADFQNLTTGARTYPNGDPNLVSTYGYLYNWYALNDARGVGPVGFRLPTMSEVQSSFNLSCFQPSVYGAAYFSKQSGTTTWLSPNQSINSTKFTALPAGEISLATNQFVNINKMGLWWTKDTDSSGTNFAKIFTMEYNSTVVDMTRVRDKKIPLSARLIAD